jgi:drug/metabolite transporter (DMT)-like permease
MEIWFRDALLSWVFAGLMLFSSKFSAEKNHSSFLVTSYSFLVCSCISLFLLLINWVSLDNTLTVLILSILNWLLYMLALLVRIEWLKNITTVIYFPINKVIAPIIIMLIAWFYFKETFSYLELFWIFLWITVPLLLVWEKENKRQKNLKKWLILLVVSTIFSTLSSATWKEVVVSGYNFFFFLTVTSITWATISYIVYHRKHKKLNDHSLSKIKRTWIISWVFLFLSIYFFMRSTVWNLGVVYTINSFSILIPIILSIIFYKEHCDKKKALAIFLSIVSLFFLW